MATQGKRDRLSCGLRVPQSPEAGTSDGREPIVLKERRRYCVESQLMFRADPVQAHQCLSLHPVTGTAAPDHSRCCCQWQSKTAYFGERHRGRSGRSPVDSRRTCWAGRRERSERSPAQHGPRRSRAGGHGAGRHNTLTTTRSVLRQSSDPAYAAYPSLGVSRQSCEPVGRRSVQRFAGYCADRRLARPD